MLNRCRLVAICFLLAAAFAALPATAAPPPDCSCDLCIPNPTSKCRIPGGGQTTCGIFLRSGICLGQLTAASAEPVILEAPTQAAPEVSAEAACDASASLAGPESQTPTWLADSCCQSQCRRDRDCDSVCGGKGAGACIQLNSCCRGCACAF
jgi:hypothetical protein